MATRGFSCPNCHTWFEGNGNHPKCPICGTRASPRDLLDDREHHAAMHEAPPPLRTAPGYDLPSRHEPPPIEYEPASDYEEPRGWDQPHEWGEAQDYEEPRGWGEVQGYEAPRGHEEPQGYQEPYGHREESASTPYQTAPSGGSDSDWSSKIGPIIGVLIFAAVIIGRICEAAGG
jgi:hypothetical protein